MARTKKVRRFEPRYGVSQLAIEAEADHLAREVKDYELLALSELKTTCTARHAHAEHGWREVQLVAKGLSERDRQIIHCLLFRDIHHILELYLAHLRRLEPLSASPRRSAGVVASPCHFSEWLFDTRKEDI